MGQFSFYQVHFVRRDCALWTSHRTVGSGGLRIYGRGLSLERGACQLLTVAGGWEFPLSDQINLNVSHCYGASTEPSSVTLNNGSERRARSTFLHQTKPQQHPNQSRYLPGAARLSQKHNETCHVSLLSWWDYFATKQLSLGDHITIYIFISRCRTHHFLSHHGKAAAFPSPWVVSSNLGWWAAWSLKIS